MDPRTAITQAATEAGIDPAWALAVAERESNLNPKARATGSSAYGLFQMIGANRKTYGGSSADPLEQSRAWANWMKTEVVPTMTQRLGRPPTPSEAYLGHYFGPTRAARMASGAIDPSTPVADAFSPAELKANPNLKGTVGAVTGDITSDITARQQRFGSEQPDYSAYGTPTGDGGAATAGSTPNSQANFERNKAWLKPGASDFTTDLGSKEPQFRQWVKDNKVPFDPNAKGPQDYDMRGFWQGLQSGDEHAKSAIDPNDNKLHYPDYWKTPYHETFSSESQWAAPNAPKWNQQDQLIDQTGKVIYDDRAPKPGNAPEPTTPDFAAYGASSSEDSGKNRPAGDEDRQNSSKTAGAPTTDPMAAFADVRLDTLNKQLGGGPQAAPQQQADPKLQADPQQQADNVRPGTDVDLSPYGIAN